MRKGSRDAGFTLYEALITLTIVGILISAGVPAFAGLLERTRLNGEQDELLSAVQYTRALAVDSAARVVMCPSADALSCSDDPLWHRGWMVFTDENGNRELEPGETVHVVHGALETGVSITSSRYRRRIGFLPTGLAYGSNLTLRICPDRPGTQAKAIIISNTGRARTAPLPAANCS